MRTDQLLKVEDGLRLGAHDVVVSTDPEAMRKHANSFHFILDAVSAQHDINLDLGLLKLDGTLALVGVPENPLPLEPFNLILPRRNFAGSCMGGIAETQELLDFCAKNDIAADIEIIGMEQINEAWYRLLKQDMRYRFVIVEGAGFHHQGLEPGRYLASDDFETPSGFVACAKAVHG